MKRFLSILLCIVMVFGLCACAGGPFSPLPPEGDAAAADPTEAPEPAETPEPATVPEEAAPAETEKPEGMIYLYGEFHYSPNCMEQELEAWGKMYENGARHLFMEYSPAWTRLDSLFISGDYDTIDEIESFIYASTDGDDEAGNEVSSTEGAAESLILRYFFLTIKERYPETILHGIDIEHQFDSIGAGYLAYLESIGEEDSEEYARELLACEQGKTTHINDDYAFRENCMVENFVYELEKLDTQDIMGIFGAAHTGLGQMNYTPSGEGATVYNMATQLAERYGERVVSTELSPRKTSGSKPDPIGPLTVNGKTYETAYVAEHDYSAWATTYKHVVYWRLKDSYDDFKDSTFSGELDPFLSVLDSQHFINYSVYMAECTKWDGSVEHIYFISGPAAKYKTSSPIISVEEG